MKKLHKSIMLGVAMAFCLIFVDSSNAKAAISAISDSDADECSGSGHECVTIEVLPGTRPIVFVKGSANFQ